MQGMPDANGVQEGWHLSEEKVRQVACPGITRAGRKKAGRKSNG